MYSKTAPVQTEIERVLDATREGVLVVDADLRVVDANRSARLVFSRSFADLEGSRVAEFIDDQEVTEAFREACINDAVSDLHLKFRPAWGGKRRFDVHIAPIVLDGEQRAIGFF